MMHSIFGIGGGFPGWFFPIVPLLMLWVIFWKGLALWHAGRRGQVWWFLILLVVNTAGVLEIIYLFGVLKMKGNDLFSKT